MKIAVFCDVHYGEEKSYHLPGQKKQIPAIINKLIHDINDLNPDIVINLGDLIDDVLDYNKDIMFLKEVCNLFKSINPPYYSIIGNHEIKTIDRIESSKTMGNNYPTFSVDMSGYHLVFLGIDSHPPIEVNGKKAYPTIINKNDLIWLESDIKNNKLPSLVFIHYPLAEDSMKGHHIWGVPNPIPSPSHLFNRREVKEVLKSDKNLIAVFSGHQHWTKIIIEDGIKYYILGSLTEVNDKNIIENVWFEVDIIKNNINIQEHHISLQ